MPVISAIWLINEYPIARKYASSYDVLVNDILKKKETIFNGVFEIDTLPSSGLLQYHSFSRDAAMNHHFVYGLDLPFSIKKK